MNSKMYKLKIIDSVVEVSTGHNNTQSKINQNIGNELLHLTTSSLVQYVIGCCFGVRACRHKVYCLSLIHI